MDKKPSENGRAQISSAQTATGFAMPPIRIVQTLPSMDDSPRRAAQGAGERRHSAVRHSPELVRASPVFKFLAPMDRLTQPVIISHGAATWLAAKVGVTQEELINRPEALHEYSDANPERYSHSISRALNMVQEDPRWPKLEISYVELRGYGRILGGWGRGLVAPVPDEGLALFEAVLDRDQSSDELWVRPTLVHG